MRSTGCSTRSPPGSHAIVRVASALAGGARGVAAVPRPAASASAAAAPRAPRCPRAGAGRLALRAGLRAQHGAPARCSRARCWWWSRSAASAGTAPGRRCSSGALCCARGAHQGGGDPAAAGGARAAAERAAARAPSLPAASSAGLAAPLLLVALGYAAAGALGRPRDPGTGPTTASTPRRSFSGGTGSTTSPLYPADSAARSPRGRGGGVRAQLRGRWDTLALTLAAWLAGAAARRPAGRLRLWALRARQPPSPAAALLVTCRPARRSRDAFGRFRRGRGHRRRAVVARSRPQLRPRRGTAWADKSLRDGQRGHLAGVRAGRPPRPGPRAARRPAVRGRQRGGLYWQTRLKPAARLL